jgi:hypothetical protein
MKEDVTEGRGKLHNEELHNLFCSLNIVETIKSSRMKLARHGTHMGEIRTT